MTCWVIRSITKITTEYVRKEIPSGTTSIQFPAGVTIESYAFEGCTGLQQLDIAPGVTVKRTGAILKVFIQTMYRMIPSYILMY